MAKYDKHDEYEDEDNDEYDDEHEYVYQLRPLVRPAAVFLILYPFILGAIHLFSKLPAVELRLLIGIYIVTALGIIFLLAVGKSKHVFINEREIVFESLLRTDVLEPQDIRRIAFYYDRKGQEIVQIRTEENDYYLNDYYFPFPELMSDLEEFVKKYKLRYTMKSKGDYA